MRSIFRVLQTPLIASPHLGQIVNGVREALNPGMSNAVLHAVDFGTSNSLLAVVRADGTSELSELSPDSDTPSVLKSVLFFTPDDGWSFGADAIREYSRAGAHGRLLRSVKKYLPDVGFRGTRIHRTLMGIEDLIGVFLREMRTRANRHTGADVRRVVLGRPARFSEDDEAEATATERLTAAARIAGYEDIELYPEPLAAARDFRHTLHGPELTLVVDLGAGTSDFTVLRLRPDGYDPSDVLAIGGVSTAGDAVDGAMMRGKIAAHFGANVRYRVPLGNSLLTMPRPLVEALCSPADAALLERKDIVELLDRVRYGCETETDREAVERLICVGEDRLGYAIFRAIEQTKIALSDAGEAPFEFRYPDADVTDTVSQDELSTMSADVVQRIVGCMDDTLARAGVSSTQVERVCLTGGTAQLAALRQELRARFGDSVVLHRTFHSVVGGLAEHARHYTT